MARHVMKASILLFAALSSVNGYWLMGIENFITTERIDPVVNAGKVSGHVHSVVGGSNFRMNTNTAALRQSECTSVPIPEDKSNYWFPHLYFQWSNGSFTSMDGGAVIYYLFSDTPGTTTAFPDDLRMITGDPTLRTYDPKSYAQQAVTFLCLDFNGASTRTNSLPSGNCPSGIRAQINFPSCWDGKNVDSPDHKSHVAFPSGGPDSGTCSDPKFPVTLPRIFLEVYWASNNFDSVRSQAMNPAQPFVFSYGDPTGYGYHADYLNGWDKGVLQKAVDGCHCNPYGDPTCCVDQGIFHMNHGQTCRITKAIDEQTTGTLNKLPGNNPVQKEGTRATMFMDPNTPALLSPIFAYTGNSPSQVGTVIVPPASGHTIASPSHASSASSTLDTPISRPSTSVLTTSSKPTPSPLLSISLPFVSVILPVVPPALVLRSSTHTTSTIAQSSPTSSGDSDEEECEEEDETDDSTHSAIPMSTQAAGNSADSSAPSITVLDPSVSASASVSSSASSTTPAPVQASSTSSDDSEECDEEDASESVSSSASSTTPATVQASPTSSEDSEECDEEDTSESVSYPTSSTSSSPVQASPTSSDNSEECDEEDDEEDDKNGASPAPPSSGSGSNHPEPASILHTPTPVVVSTSSTPTGKFLPVESGSSAQPVCATGKFRHKRLREQKAQEKRSYHHGRSFHDRFVRSHHARVF